MAFRDTQNPGIGGLDEITDSEALFLQNLSSLSYAQGDILYHNGTNLTRLPAGTSGYFLKTQGAGANPIWAASSGSGDVVGPASSTDNAVARFDLTTGKLLQDSVVLIGDTGAITGALSINLSGLTADRIVSTNGSKTLETLSTATYPSLTELSYVKGVTSAIQTQLGTKAPTASPTFTGTVTVPATNFTVGASLPFSDSAGTLTLQNVDALDATTEATIEAAIDTLANLASIGSFTGVLRADAGTLSVDSDVTDIVTAASLTAAGKVELATTAEINTGTDSTRAMPVDQYVASNRNVRYVLYRVVEATTDTATATTKGGDLEFPFTGTITEIGAYVDTAGTTGTMTVDVNLNGTTIMTTNKITIDSTEKSSRTAATAPALTTTAITAGDLITVDIDAIHTTAAKGLTIRLGVRLT